MHNSKISRKKNNKIKSIVKQFGRVLFAIIGIICSSIFMFMLLNSGYSKIYDPSMITNCINSNSSNGSVYLQSFYSLETLLIILDGLCIFTFTFLLFLSVFYALCPGSNNRFQIKQGARIILTYVVFLSCGCLFGNCVKTIVGVNEVLGCTSDYSSLQKFSKNTQSLAVISGVSMIAGIGLFFLNPILLRRQQEYNGDQKKQEVNLQNKSEQILNQIKTGPPLTIQLNSKSRIQLTSQNIEQKKIKNQEKQQKPPRIFGKQFLGSRYLNQIKSGNKNKEQSMMKAQIKNQIYDTQNKKQKGFEEYTPYNRLNDSVDRSQVNVRRFQVNQADNNVRHIEITFGSQIEDQKRIKSLQSPVKKEQQNFTMQQKKIY